MNESAILALIGDLYNQVAQLQQENEHLRQQLGRKTKEGRGDINPDKPKEL